MIYGERSKVWKPNRESKQPIYRQIAAELERSIASGELPPASTLPSERRLAQQLGVNRSTIIQAYDELRAAGLVESAVGSGTRVSSSKWGVHSAQAPNWQRYTDGGAFLPNLPLMRKVREAAQRGEGMIDLASGELSEDLFPGELVQSILQQRPFSGYLGYDDPQGNLALRRAIGRFLHRYHGWEVSESSILITSGSQQSLYLINQCLLSPGDAVALEAPSYSYSLSMFQSAGLRIFRLPVHDNGVDPEDILRLHREHRIRMIFLNPNFQNPTGTVLAADKRKQVLAAASSLGIPIVEDDPFSLTAFSGAPPPLLKSADRDGSVLYVGTLSKIAASGLRIGWMVGPRAVISRLSDAKQQMDFGLGSLSQWAAAELLEHPRFHSHLSSLQLSLLEKQLEMESALNDLMLGKLTYTPPQGGLNLWCKLPPGIDESRLLDEAIRRGVVFVPGSVYGAEPGFIRLCYARPPYADIRPGIAALAAALEAVEWRPGH